MNDYAVRIDIGEKESVATYMSPSGGIIEQFTFLLNPVGVAIYYTTFTTAIFIFAMSPDIQLSYMINFRLERHYLFSKRRNQEERYPGY